MKDKTNHPLYLSLRLALKHIARQFFRLRGFTVLGKNFLPKKRCGCLLIANHAAFVDSVYIISALKPRFTICGAKPKYFLNPVSRELFRIANIMKVENKEQFLQDCSRLFQRGENLLIYPEMGRNFESMGEFKTWAAEAALASGAEIIPLYLYGTTKNQDDKKRLIVGQPIKPQGSAEDLTKKFRETINNLKPTG